MNVHLPILSIIVPGLYAVLIIVLNFALSETMYLHKYIQTYIHIDIQTYRHTDMYINT